ncbi:PAP/25A-associated [Macleaya cordata]|uniref:PAP/25A-associated n=1 Tax=Macleaya cordata TaxID=56857 RepID=A0A200PMI3_MACCD|nr:PAP/25A-associated [Macleaya cordata]
MSFFNNSSSNGSVLERSLSEILAVIKPSEGDVSARTQIINELRAIVESIQNPCLRGAAVEPFGSFVSNLYSRWGDLDISIQVHRAQFPVFSNYHRTALREIMEALQLRGGFRILNFLPDIRVPLLVVESTRNNISCDISINNWPGQVKSKILLWITQIDERFQDMVLLIKEWAKSEDINNSKNRTLTSYALCLLAIFHFQTCEPAIFPPLNEIYAGNTIDNFGVMKVTSADDLRNIHDTCTANIERFRRNNSRNVNRSCLSELLVSFFEKFSRIDMMAPEQAICTYTGRWELRRNNTRWRRTSPFIVEDPFERPENAARAVTFQMRRKMSAAFQTTHQKLLLAGRDRSSLIYNLVRPEISSQIIT